MNKSIKKILLVGGFISLVIALFFVVCCEKAIIDNIQTTGKGGSMARFTISHDHLYVVDDKNLKVFNIEQANSPQYIRDIPVGLNIETIYPYKDYLFIGSEIGMYAYSIQAPDNPLFLSKIEHIQACDPVVVNDSLAFLTLRSGGDCRLGASANQLEIIDITDLKNLKVLKIYPMDTPFGLGIDGHLLFICHGDYGLGIYDFSNYRVSLNTIKRIYDLKTFDVIPFNKILFVIGETGFYQYSYANLDSIFLLSHIPVVK